VIEATLEEPTAEEEEKHDVKVQSDTDESEGCFSDPCPNRDPPCRGGRVCKSDSSCNTWCAKPDDTATAVAKAFDSVKVQSDTDESESRCADPCANANCNSPQKPYCKPDPTGACSYKCSATPPATDLLLMQE
jgi:hypothetical protein